jgi:hypothetical protein
LVSMGTWAWVGEHEQLNKIKFFLEYFVDIKGILKGFFGHMAKKNHDVEEYFTTCTWMNDIYGWNIIMDERYGWTI